MTVLTRKNALFAGSDERAENWAVLASLIETCKLHRVNPEAYFTDILTRLVNNWPNSRRDELMPWACRLTLKRLAAAGFGWPLPAEMTDAVLEARLFTAVGTKQGTSPP